MKKLLLTLSAVVALVFGAKAEIQTATLDFGANEEFASWGSSYAEHTLNFTEAVVKFTKANKQGSNASITDCPVSKGSDITVLMNEGFRPLKEITLNVKRWASKTQTIKAYASTDGETFAEEACGTLNVEADGDAEPSLEITDLPEGCVAVKFACTNNQNQIGWVSAVVTYGDAEGVSISPVRFSVASGNVTAGTQVELTCASEDAAIYYTLDGSTPSDASTKYTAPITINESLTIRAIAYVGADASPVTSATYTVVASLSLADIIALDNNASFVMGSDLIVVYKNGAYVYVVDKDATSVPGLVYKYDQPVNPGDVVTAGWEGKVSIYNGLVELVPNANLEANGTATVPSPAELSNASDVTEGMINRQVLLKEVVFDEETLATKAMFTGTLGNGQVTFWNNFKIASTPAGSYNVLGFVAINGSTIQVYPIEYIPLETVVLKPAILPAYTDLEIGDEITITCGTEGAAIYYTLDGTDPTADSNEYSEPIVLTEAAESLTVKAVAILDGVSSEIAEATYTVTDPGTSKTAVFTDWNNLLGVETEGSQGVAKNSVDWTVEVKGVTLNIKNGDSTNSYVKPTDLRVYKHYTMTFTAPEGYNIVEINTTKGGKTFTEGIESSLPVLTIENNEVHWTGEAAELEWTITGTVSFATISVTVEKATGIETISSENAPEVYYNLQGVRVANPTNGIFVRVSGNKAEKIIK